MLLIGIAVSGAGVLLWASLRLYHLQKITFLQSRGVEILFTDDISTGKMRHY